MSSNGYNSKIVLAYWCEVGVPKPLMEFQIVPERKWRLDFAWVEIPIKGRSMPVKVALEIDGGIWTAGAHVRGARLLKIWERDNELAAMGWRMIRCQPRDLCVQQTTDIIKRCLRLPI